MALDVLKSKIRKHVSNCLFVYTGVILDQVFCIRKVVLMVEVDDGREVGDGGGGIDDSKRSCDDIGVMMEVVLVMMVVMMLKVFMVVVAA